MLIFAEGRSFFSSFFYANIMTLRELFFYGRCLFYYKKCRYHSVRIIHENCSSKCLLKFSNSSALHLCIFVLFTIVIFLKNSDLILVSDYFLIFEMGFSLSLNVLSHQNLFYMVNPENQLIQCATCYISDSSL